VPETSYAGVSAESGACGEMATRGISSDPARENRIGAEVFFGAETGVRSDFHSGNTWAPKGKTPIIRTTGARFGFNMISSVSTKGQMRFMVVQGRVAAQNSSANFSAAWFSRQRGRSSLSWMAILFIARSELLMSSYVRRYDFKVATASRLFRFAAWDTEYTELHRKTRIVFDYYYVFIRVIRILRVLFNVCLLMN
jgi:hypothetical protein